MGRLRRGEINPPSQQANAATRVGSFPNCAVRSRLECSSRSSDLERLRISKRPNQSLSPPAEPAAERRPNDGVADALFDPAKLDRLIERFRRAAENAPQQPKTPEGRPRAS